MPLELAPHVIKESRLYSHGVLQGLVSRLPSKESLPCSIIVHSFSSWLTEIRPTLTLLLGVGRNI